MRPVEIGATLRLVLAKLVMREAGDQAKTACDNLQLCTVLEDGIEGATHAVGQTSLKRVHVRRQEGEEGGESFEEEYSRGVVDRLNKLTL